MPVYSSGHSTANQAATRRVPRANPPPVKAIELMGINLHQERAPSRDVDKADVKYMRNTMNHHCEETNELYNLMARHIKKRCEERINLFQVEDGTDKASNANIAMINEEEMDQFLLNEDDEKLTSPRQKAIENFMRNTDVGGSTSRGNSPPKEEHGSVDKTMMQTMLSQR